METFDTLNSTVAGRLTTWTTPTTPPSIFGLPSVVTSPGPPTHLAGILQQLIVVVGSSLSLVFIAFAFITFTLFSDLKDLAGFVMMNLFSSVFMGQLFLLIGMDQAESDALCHFFAISLHFVWLAAFFWISVGVYDISQDVNTRLAPSISDGNGSLRNYVIAYSLYGWGIPALIVALCSLVYFTKHTADEDGFTYVDPRRLHCWMLAQDGVLVGLVLPFLWLLSASSYWFYKSWRIMHRTMLLSCKTGVRKRFKRPEMIMLHLYLKLTLIYLSTWFLGFISAMVPDSNTIWLAFVGALSAAGTFIALLFTCNSAVFTVYSSTKKRSRRHSEVQSYGAPSDLSFGTALSLLTLRDHEVPEAANSV
ncbi:hypothetical protein RvY_07139 [Ramazzottius varieornatus]|uniref:G-protein coupled receptors family 2 profile 2 domain-containing protein n=1 Tax=Ramazzottius varieornatus TaxID=947166 RepID=A0A1D1VAJ6_RAMVA|nr:hypothetical protein RvY_07139 [Ramazzottius varieornatus]